MGHMRHRWHSPLPSPLEGEGPGVRGPFRRDFVLRLVPKVSLGTQFPEAPASRDWRTLSIA